MIWLDEQYFEINFDTKPSLEFYMGLVGSRTLFHSMKNWLTKDSAPLNPSQIFWDFQKWYNHVWKVPISTTYAISCDVIGNYDMVDPDISCERSDKGDPIRIHSPFFEALSSAWNSPICAQNREFRWWRFDRPNCTRNNRYGNNYRE